MSNPNPQGVQKQQWWLSKQGKPVGPHDEAFVQDGLRTGKIPAQTYACPVGGQEWKRLCELPAFAHLCPPKTDAEQHEASLISRSTSSESSGGPEVPIPILKTDCRKSSISSQIINTTIICVLATLFLGPCLRSPDLSDLARTPDGKPTILTPPSPMVSPTTLNAIKGALLVAAIGYWCRKRTRVAKCPSCDNPLTIEEQLAGCQVVCPMCKALLHASADRRQLTLVGRPVSP